ncbi:MAG: PEP-CTERM sorting domain-containing protein [Candidatus Omnitrophica bacterium]|nr:PEP-CTERM sorting domain-containing protein [Candidatus Omnitrophota bacterium]
MAVEGKGGIIMKKVVSLVCAVLVGMMVQGVAEAYTTSLTFSGSALYDLENPVYFTEEMVPDADTREFLNGEDPFTGVGVIDYTIDWDLPEWDEPRYWSVDASASLYGEYVDGSGTHHPDMDLHWSSGTAYMGHFSLQTLFGGMTEDQVVNQIVAMLDPYYSGDLGGYAVLEEGLGGIALVGDLNAGTIYLGTLEDIDSVLFQLNEDYDGSMDVTSADVTFSGQVNATAAATPEPTTVFMLLSGLCGLAGVGFKKKQKE